MEAVIYFGFELDSIPPNANLGDWKKAYAIANGMSLANHSPDQIDMHVQVAGCIVGSHDGAPYFAIKESEVIVGENQCCQLYDLHTKPDWSGKLKAFTSKLQVPWQTPGWRLIVRSN